MEERTHSPGRATEAFFRTHPQAVVVYDPQSLELLAANPRALEVFGLPTGAVPGKGLPALHVGDLPVSVRRDYMTAQTPFLASMNGASTVRLKGRRGEFEAVVSVFELVYGGKIARMAICAELGARRADDAFYEERKALEQRVDYLANNDPVTDLPNRQRFETLLLDAMASAKSAKHKVAVLYLELHGFRLIHDAVSQDAADDMLRLAARRLKSVAQGSTVARFGTDEFAIITRPLHDTVDATNIAQRVVGGLVEPVVLEGRSVTFRPRVGVAVFPDHAETPGALLKAASQAKYRAKAARGPSFAVFRPAMQVRVQERLELEDELRQAFGTGQLVIYYQPRVDLRSGKLVGVEALVRWRHPERGLLSPDSFVPLAEETGQIVSLGQEVLGLALDQVVRWQQAGFIVPRVAVNVSPLQLRGGGFFEDVRKALHRSGLEGGRLEVEVTETAALADRRRGSDVLAELRRLGVRVALDDFGTGYASLAHLQDLPVDALKLDRAFLEQGPSGPAAGEFAILKAVAALGRALGVEVTAEGVESDDQLRQVIEAGCDSVQGFLVSQPVAAALVQDAARNGKAVLDRARAGHR